MTLSKRLKAMYERLKSRDASEEAVAHTSALALVEIARQLTRLADSFTKEETGGVFEVLVERAGGPAKEE